MKSTMKLCLIMASCISATAYCAEKPLNPDEIIRKAQATGKPIPAATVNQMIEQQKKCFAQDAVEFKAMFGQSIPAKTISIADPETPTLAHEHNRKFQLHNEQPK